MSKSYQLPASVLNVQDEVPSGTCNFSNVTFVTTLAAIPGSLKVFLNGIRLFAPADYSASNTTTAGVTTITMVEAPHTNDIVMVDYTFKI